MGHGRQRRTSLRIMPPSNGLAADAGFADHCERARSCLLFALQSLAAGGSVFCGKRAGSGFQPLGQEGSMPDARLRRPGVLSRRPSGRCLAAAPRLTAAFAPAWDQTGSQEARRGVRWGGPLTAPRPNPFQESKKPPAARPRAAGDGGGNDPASTLHNLQIAGDQLLVMISSFARVAPTSLTE